VTQEPQPARLGRVEQAVLDELTRRGVITPRSALLPIVYPSLAPGDARRATAEAAVSRALRSLEAKGLVVRERDSRTGRTSVRAPGMQALPRWEQLARAEEDLAAHCRQRARDWQQLASRATRRAARLRSDRASEGTEPERTADLERIARLDQRRR